MIGVKEKTLIYGFTVLAAVPPGVELGFHGTEHPAFLLFTVTGPLAALFVVVVASRVSSQASTEPETEVGK